MEIFFNGIILNGKDFYEGALCYEIEFCEKAVFIKLNFVKGSDAADALYRINYVENRRQDAKSSSYASYGTRNFYLRKYREKLKTGWERKKEKTLPLILILSGNFCEMRSRKLFISHNLFKVF